jgi:hypothetical protein
MITVSVREGMAYITGLDPLRLNDLYQDAPEPKALGLNGLKAVGANLLYLLEKLPESIWNDPSGRLLEARAHRYLEALHRRPPDDNDRAFPFKMEPKSYQLQIFAQAWDMPNVALAPVAPGTGKTKLAIDIAARKFMEGLIDGAMVVADPPGVVPQWINEGLPNHMTRAVRYVADRYRPTRKVDKRVMDPHEKRMRWLAFNVDAFRGSSGKARLVAETFLKSGRMFLIEDESSRIKTPAAERTKALIGSYGRGKRKPGLRDFAACRMIMTGTPITKGIEDLWAQYEFLDPDIIGMSNYYAFRARYCVTAPAFRGAAFGQVKITGYRNVEEFVKKIAPVTFVVPKTVLGLPEKTYEEIPVELTRDQKMAYNAMRNRLVDDLKEMKIATPKNAAVRLTRLQQILCGRVYEQPSDLEEPPFAKPISSNRIKTLTEWIEANSQDEQLVIWCRFIDDILDVEKALLAMGRKPVTYYGATTDDAREAAKRAFVRGDASDFIGNPSTAGMGLDGLQRAAERAIYYSSSFNREHRWQSEDRIHRLGMRGTAWYGDMIAPGTVDRMILNSYKETEELIESVMRRPELVPTLNED